MNAYAFKVRPLVLAIYLLVALSLPWIWPHVGWAQSDQTQYYTVRSGDTLSHIAYRVYKNASLWREIYQANKEQIRDPKKLVVGWELLIPNLPDESDDTPAVSGTQPEAAKTELGVTEAEPMPLSVLTPQVMLPPADGNQSITFATGSEYPPFTGLELPQQGMLTDVVRTTFGSMGYDVGFNFGGLNHGLKTTQKGRFAGTFPHFIDRAHLPHFFYSKPLFRMLIRGFVRGEKTFRFEQIEDLSGRVVCRPEGHDLYDLQPLLVQQRMTLKTPKLIETCFKLLMQGDVDVVSVNEFAGQGVLHRAGLTKHICMLDNVVSIDTMHLLFPKQLPQSKMRMEAFDKALTRLEAAGALDAIYSQHLKQYYDRLGTPPTYCASDATSNSPLTKRQ